MPLRSDTPTLVERDLVVLRVVLNKVNWRIKFLFLGLGLGRLT